MTETQATDIDRPNRATVDETPALVIVCERRGTWAAALRRELADAGVRIRETRSLADCWAALAESPASLAVVELTPAGAAALLERMAWLGRDFPRARAAVVADRSLAGYEWLLREAGAVHFVVSPRRLAPLGRLACRHLAEAPAPKQDFIERLWASLPWKPRGGPRTT